MATVKINVELKGLDKLRRRLAGKLKRLDPMYLLFRGDVTNEPSRSAIVRG